MNTFDAVMTQKLLSYLLDPNDTKTEQSRAANAAARAAAVGLAERAHDRLGAGPTADDVRRLWPEAPKGAPEATGAITADPAAIDRVLDSL